jgi:hypothetical protein
MVAPQGRYAWPITDCTDTRSSSSAAGHAERPDQRGNPLGAAAVLVERRELQPEHWVDAACRVASRNLTRDEWTTYIGNLAPYHETCPAP